MNRNVIAMLVLSALAGLSLWAVELRADAQSIFGRGTGGVPETLENAEARQLVIAVVSPDRDERTALAHAMASMLAEERLVAAVNLGPEMPARGTIDFLWHHRFRLAPPAPEDLSVEGMVAQLHSARTALASVTGVGFGDYLLRDPTGSFARLIDGLATANTSLQSHDGVWQAQDGSAALLFVSFTTEPFDASAVIALADSIRQVGAVDGVETILLGPRVAAAEINAAMTRSSLWVSLAALGLLILWFSWALRSLRALATVMLTIALSLAAATLVVQAVFGWVHVIALGFGGALMGLAVDYPLHLMSHGRQMRREAGRLVMLGAATTAIAFLAAVSSGLQAFVQVGVFVASGLGTAAAASRWLVGGVAETPRVIRCERLLWRFPAKPMIEIAMAVAGLATVYFFSGPSPQLFALPSGLTSDIAAMRQMVSLPSGQYHLRVQGATAEEVLALQAEIAPDLDAAVATGLLGRYSMLGTFLPPASQQLTELPEAEVFAERAAAALSASGMAVQFLDTLLDAYGEAVAAPVVTPEMLQDHADLAPFAERVRFAGGHWRETVRLWEIQDPERLAAAIERPGVEFIDVSSEIADRLGSLQRHVLLGLGIGAAVAIAVLALAGDGTRRALAIGRSIAASLGLTVVILILVGGPLSVFEILALTLVVGIGIDYGIFIGFARDAETQKAAARSVGLCAISTMMAFGVMAQAPFQVLSEIGTAVSLGIGATLVISFGRTRDPGETR